MFLHFSSDSIISGRGFNASYSKGFPTGANTSTFPDQAVSICEEQESSSFSSWLLWLNWVVVILGRSLLIFLFV